MEDNFYDETMDMPTPCVNCNKIFDLHEGYGSEKWHPNTIICEDCYRQEKVEIEEDEYWANVNIELSNALYELPEKENAWNKLEKENQEAIKKLFEQSK